MRAGPEDLPAMLAMNLEEVTVKNYAGIWAILRNSQRRAILGLRDLLSLAILPALRVILNIPLGRRVLLIGTDEKAKEKKLASCAEQVQDRFQYQTSNLITIAICSGIRWCDLFGSALSIWHAVRIQLESDVNYMAKNEEVAATLICFALKIFLSQNRTSVLVACGCRILSRDILMLFLLNEELSFPPVEYADETGLLAMGGDLSVERLLLAYQRVFSPGMMSRLSGTVLTRVWFWI